MRVLVSLGVCELMSVQASMCACVHVTSTTCVYRVSECVSEHVGVCVCGGHGWAECVRIIRGINLCVCACVQECVPKCSTRFHNVPKSSILFHNERHFTLLDWGWQPNQVNIAILSAPSTTSSTQANRSLQILQMVNVLQREAKKHSTTPPHEATVGCPLT